MFRRVEMQSECQTCETERPDRALNRHSIVSSPDLKTSCDVHTACQNLEHDFPKHETPMMPKDDTATQETGFLVCNLLYGDDLQDDVTAHWP
jgi:hypothetical protein